MGNKVLSNQRVQIRIGPDTAIADYEAPMRFEYDSLVDVSEAVKWDGLDFNIAASEQSDSRSLTDAAGAQTRGAADFGGAIEFFTPKPEDTGSILRIARDLVKEPRTRLAVGIRVVTLNSVGAEIGDEVNVYRTITDANRHNRAETDYSYSINFVPQDDLGVNRILPSGTPTAVVTTPATAITGTVGDVGFFTAEYEGRNVTIGSEYIAADPSVIEVLPHGAWRLLKAGSTTVRATYPGSAAGAARAVTVTA